jgi:hypothetical protein
MVLERKETDGVWRIADLLLLFVESLHQIGSWPFMPGIFFGWLVGSFMAR